MHAESALLSSSWSTALLSASRDVVAKLRVSRCATVARYSETDPGRPCGADRRCGCPTDGQWSIQATSKTVRVPSEAISQSSQAYGHGLASGPLLLFGERSRRLAQASRSRLSDGGRSAMERNSRSSTEERSPTRYSDDSVFSRGRRSTRRRPRARPRGRGGCAGRPRHRARSPWGRRRRRSASRDSRVRWSTDGAASLPPRCGT